MSNTKHEEYQTPSCQVIHFELSGNVMSPKPQIAINDWEEEDEI